MENKKIVKFINVLVEKGYLDVNSNSHTENLIEKFSSLEEKISDAEFDEFQRSFFIAIENIKDDYFELGMIAGKVMQDE
ncbi:hypothetical protein [Fusobacterium polymorphum]|uniref:hypothetical protein n=1 Tax=Fusobacterium nucleatum subsp. polymorphum TaxID=76857 RepID=UPI00300A8B1B